MSIANDYHNETKYHPETIGNGPAVDWNSQPSPFKEFHSQTRIDLRSHLLLARDEESERPVLQEPDPVSPTYELSRLATLLLHVSGVTAQQPTHDEPMLFRASPSAGALYPTEIYVALRDFPGIDDGIYNFQVKDHSLAPVMEGKVWGDLEAATFGSEAIKESRVVILFSVIFARSSWRYHDRAYRRILLDSGHVLGNLMTFGPEIGFAPKTITAFQDQALDELMFFDRNSESTLLLAALPEKETKTPELGASPRAELGEDDDIILGMHRAGIMPLAEAKIAERAEHEDLQPSKAQLTIPLSRRAIAWENDLGPTILLRRSTRGFGMGPMTSEQLGMILGFAYQGCQDENNDFIDVGRLKTCLSVHRVDGLDSGLYRYDPVNSRLHLLRRGYFGREDHELGLGQELMRDACVNIFHFADIEEACQSTGDRSYRYLKLDCGHIGQRINLATLKLGLGVSGIAGYFDDQANALFHRPDSEGLLYITSIGATS